MSRAWRKTASLYQDDQFGENVIQPPHTRVVHRQAKYKAINSHLGEQMLIIKDDSPFQSHSGHS